MTPDDPDRRLSARERVLAGLPAVLLVSLGLLHLLWLRPVVGMSTWKGGGLGVYCTVLERRVATWVDLGDGPRLAHSTPAPHARLFAGWFPYVPLIRPGWLATHARVTLSTPHAPAPPLDDQSRARPAPGGQLPQAVVVQQWTYVYDPDGPRWRLHAVSTAP